MFKGHTKMEVNEATMIEAMQEYIAKRVLVTPVPRVSGVKSVASGYGTNTFNVTLDAGEMTIISPAIGVGKSTMGEGGH